MLGKSYAVEHSEHYCVIPIKNVPNLDSLRTYRLVRDRWQLKGIEQPLYVNNINKPPTTFGAWTINKDYKFQPFDYLAPTHPWDEYIEESWNGRVVFNKNIKGKNIITLENGKSLFKQLDQSLLKGRTYYRGLVTISSRKETIVFTRNGIPYLVGKDYLTSWPTYHILKQNNISLLEVGLVGLKPIYDAPALDGFLFVSNKNEIFLYNDSGIEKIDIGKIDSVQKTINLSGEGIFVLVGRENIHVIQRSDEGKLSTKSYFSSEKLHYRHLKTMEQFLWYDASISNWTRLTKKGFVPIVINGSTLNPKSHRIKEVPYLKLALLDTSKEIFQYDGESTIKVFDYPSEQKYNKIFVLPSIEKALIITKDKRLFSFEKNKPLKQVATEFELSTPLNTSLFDWPNAELAFIINQSGIHTVDKNLTFKKLLGGDVFKPYYPLVEVIGHNNASGDIFFVNKRGLFAVVDKNNIEYEHCQHKD